MSRTFLVLLFSLFSALLHRLSWRRPCVLTRLTACSWPPNTRAHRASRRVQSQQLCSSVHTGPVASWRLHTVLVILEPEMVNYCCRWTSVVVVTNPFHQFRSLRTFKCAAKQSLPPGEQPQVRRNRVHPNAKRTGRFCADPLLKLFGVDLQSTCIRLSKLATVRLGCRYGWRGCRGRRRCCRRTSARCTHCGCSTTSCAS